MTSAKPAIPAVFQVMIDMNALSSPKRKRKKRPLLTSPGPITVSSTAAELSTVKATTEFVTPRKTRLSNLAARRERIKQRKSPRRFNKVLSIFNDGSRKAPLEGRVSHIYKRKLRKKNKLLAASTPRQG